MNIFLENLQDRLGYLSNVDNQKYDDFLSDVLNVSVRVDYRKKVLMILKIF